MSGRTFLLGAVVLAFAGFSFSDVKLKTDKPLIELQKTVTESALGNEDTMLDIPEEIDDGEPQDDDLKEDEPIQVTVFHVRIRERVIYVGEFRASGSESAADMLGSTEDSEVVLIDDFADYLTYTDMRETLVSKDIPFYEEVPE